MLGFVSSGRPPYPLGAFPIIHACGLVYQSGSIGSRTYDPNSNLITRNTTPQTSDYHYDALDRLIGDSIDNAQSSTFNYDLSGNRLRKGQAEFNEEEYTYLAGSNRLLLTEKLDNDEPANLNTIVARATTYNDANRRYQVFAPGVIEPIATYIFNAQGQRTRKITADGTVIYHYDSHGMLITETRATGELIKDYIWNGMSPVAQIDSVAGTETVSFLHTDHLYTPRFATNSSGTIVWRWEGEAFGETNDEALNQFTYNLRFPGQYFDVETQTHYNWMRSYDPSLGRYVQSDPIGLEAGINTYAYVGNNPLSRIDPKGLWGFYVTGNIEGSLVWGISLAQGFYIGSNGVGPIDSFGGVIGVEAGAEIEFGFYTGNTPPKDVNGFEIELDTGPVGFCYGETTSGKTMGMNFGPGSPGFLTTLPGSSFSIF